MAAGLAMLGAVQLSAAAEPDTIIDSGPSGPTNDPTPSFTFHSTDASATFECSIDTGTEAFGPCANPSPALADGFYTFRVRSKNQERETDLSPATRTFTVDTIPPDTIIDSGPSGETEDPTPTFTFHSTEGGSTFECSIDTGTPAFGPCAALTQELGDGAYAFRVRSTDLAGNADPSPATREFTLVDLPPPVYGETVNVEPVSGTVRVRPRGKHRFVKLRSGRQIKVGSAIDVSGGRVHLTSAKSKGGPSQGADFYDGIFRVTQPPQGTPITVLKLLSGGACPSAGPRTAVAARSKGNGLWGSGHGNFRSEGKHGSATVRGTIWFTEDRCDGTFFRVARGVVTVHDFTKHKTVTLHVGSTYLAATP